MNAEQLRQTLIEKIGFLLSYKRLVYGENRRILQGLKNYLPSMPVVELERMLTSLPVKSPVKESAMPEKSKPVSRGTQSRSSPTESGKGSKPEGGVKGFEKKMKGATVKGQDSFPVGCGPIETCCLTIRSCSGKAVAHFGTDENEEFVLEFKHIHEDGTEHCKCLTADQLCALLDSLETEYGSEGGEEEQEEEDS